MTYVDPFLGAGAVWLHLVSPALVPPVAWMGGKRRLAAEILRALGLPPGEPVPCLLGDASWWGWVWPAILDADSGPRICEVLRSWRQEDPRELWFRLRAAGPFGDRAEAAAQLLWLQARAASGVPVWWEGGKSRMWDRTRSGNVGPALQGHANEPGLVQKAHGRGPYPASMCGEARLLQWASTKIDEAGQRQACAKGFHTGSRGGGIVDTGTVAHRLDHVRTRLLEATRQRHAGPRIEHRDALALTEEWAPRIGAEGRVYLDPPYQGATGYPAACPRSEVLQIAETWARHGARVVLSEAVGLAADLGAGWTQTRLPTRRKSEWVTCWGCEVDAFTPALFREWDAFRGAST